ncbi:hypothetical protein M9H77_26905 [Catharanthus roseus]|uniref:Uncharacterized protein n=1 Tax=Catharanthus roseus TaxID=4058 RepID=A0ACC0ADP2_CATRO|nr:hypothetical protein M9H77_26905 [Catharanthus roseus]
MSNGILIDPSCYGFGVFNDDSFVEPNVVGFEFKSALFDDHHDRSIGKSMARKIEEQNTEMVVLFGKNIQGCTWKYIGRRRCRLKRHQNAPNGNDAQEGTKRSNCGRQKGLKLQLDIRRRLIFDGRVGHTVVGRFLFQGVSRTHPTIDGLVRPTITEVEDPKMKESRGLYWLNDPDLVTESSEKGEKHLKDMSERHSVSSRARVFFESLSESRHIGTVVIPKPSKPYMYHDRLNGQSPEP